MKYNLSKDIQDTAMELFVCGFNGFGQILNDSKTNFILTSPVSVSLILPDNVEPKESCENVMTPACLIRDVQLSWDKMFVIFEGNHGLETGTHCRNLKNIKSASISWQDIYYTNREGHCKLQHKDKEITVKSSEDGCDVHLSTVVTGNMHSVALSDRGRIFCIEKSTDSFVYRPLDDSLHIRAVSCGKEHVILLSVIGVTFTYGIGGQGQLGHGSVENEDQPRIVAALEGITVTSVSAGGWHSTALSDIGDVYVWGWNERGQLGFPSRIVQEQREKHSINSQAKSVPDESEDAPVSKRLRVTEGSEESNSVTCLDKTDGDHICHERTQVLDNLNSVFGDTQLALKGQQPSDQKPINVDSELVNIQPFPRVLDFISSSGDFINMHAVSCGSRHTAALTEDGSVYTWGWNDYGQLGHGDTISRDSPAPVKLTPHRRVKKVFCGAWNTALIG